MGNLSTTYTKKQILEQEELCNNKYDDLMFCEKEYGFNDLKCHNYYLKRYQTCVTKLQEMK